MDSGTREGGAERGRAGPTNLTAAQAHYVIVFHRMIGGKPRADLICNLAGGGSGRRRDGKQPPTPNRWTIARFQRWAGLAGIIGGIALAVAYLMHPPAAPPETVASALWAWVHILFMVSLVGGIFLLLALLVRYSLADGGMAGFVGFAMALVGLVFVFGLDNAEVFIFPSLAVEFPAVVSKYGDGAMMPSLAFAFPLNGPFLHGGFRSVQLATPS